jgi:hypothetical protein
VSGAALKYESLRRPFIAPQAFYKNGLKAQSVKTIPNP